jgi:hypothetical protein
MISDLFDEVASALADKVLVPILGLGLSHAALRTALERFVRYRREGSSADPSFLNSLSDYRRIAGEGRWLWFGGVSLSGVTMLAMTLKIGPLPSQKTLLRTYLVLPSLVAFASLYPPFRPPSFW